MFDFEADSEIEDTKYNEEVESDGEGVQTNEAVGLGGVEDDGVDLDDVIEVEGVDLGDGVEVDRVDLDDGVEVDRVDFGDGVEMGGEIKFFVGQSFGSNEEMRDIFKEYAIREGVTLGRIKNDLVRQTYICKSDGCPWRAHGSQTIDKKSFILKTLVDKHDCHRVYNNSKAKVKWIASRVESLVKSNPTVSVKLLGDLLLERYNVAVDMKKLYNVAIDMKKLYNVKHRLMSQLTTEHNNCFRQKGLINTLETHFPLASTRSSYPGDNYKKMFWMASRSSNLFHFNAALDSIREVDIRAKEWLKKIDPHYWSRFAYDQYIKYDHVTNNMTEAFNKMLGTHRAQTYLQLLKFVRCMVMRKLQQRKEECDTWKDVLPPIVNARIVKNSKASRQLTIISTGAQEYELLGPDGTFAMKMREYHCGCGSWQISGIPCPHAMAAISHSYGTQSMKDWVLNFFHQSLSKSAYIQTYRGMIHPLHDQKMWPPIEKDELLPPPYETQPGRPKMQRKREAGEKAKGGRNVCMWWCWTNEEMSVENECWRDEEMKK
ncbi:hypothetical protein Q3G72_010693 [Acer saccharum]|nr:hypothetical protein Q3G72_010693 [Acer saccharum]